MDKPARVGEPPSSPPTEGWPLMSTRTPKLRIWFWVVLIIGIVLVASRVTAATVAPHNPPPPWLSAIFWTVVPVAAAFLAWADIRCRLKPAEPEEPEAPLPPVDRRNGQVYPREVAYHPVANLARPRTPPPVPVQGIDKPSNERTDVIPVGEELRRTKVAPRPRVTDVPPLDFNDPRIQAARRWGFQEAEMMQDTEDDDDPPPEGPVEDRP
jgi:hypothetical protein